MVKKVRKINSLILLLCIFSSCFSQESDEEKMFNTVNLVTYCVNDLDTVCLYGYLAEGVSFSLSDIYYNAESAYYFMTKYYNNKIDSVRYTRDSVSSPKNSTV